MASRPRRSSIPANLAARAVAASVGALLLDSLPPTRFVFEFSPRSLDLPTAARPLEVGQRCEVLVSAYEGGMFAGAISEIGIAADPASRLFRVVLKLDNADGRLKSGMTASVRLGGRASHAVSGVSLPLSALVAADKTGKRSAVFVVGDDGRAHLRQIQTSEIVGSAILVTDGLQAGDKIVTLGTGLLSDLGERTVARNSPRAMARTSFWAVFALFRRASHVAWSF
jgi:RND family efflux transporter MFP subunit